MDMHPPISSSAQHPDRASADATDFIFSRHPQAFIAHLARRFHADRDEVQAVGWEQACRLARNGHDLAASVKNWKQRVNDVVRDECGRSTRYYCCGSDFIEIQGRTPEWHLLAAEDNGQPSAISSWHHDVNDIVQATLDASTLAKQMHISIRHARRYVTRWHLQNEVSND